MPHLGPGINQMLQALSYYIVGSIAEEAPFARKQGKNGDVVFQEAQVLGMFSKFWK